MLTYLDVGMENLQRRFFVGALRGPDHFTGWTMGDSWSWSGLDAVSAVKRHGSATRASFMPGLLVIGEMCNAILLKRIRRLQRPAVQ